MNDLLLQDEIIDDLQIKGLKIIQKINGFKFGMDAVLLSDFCDMHSESRVLDLGTGTGIIPFLIYAKKNVTKLVGIEIQSSMCEMARRSIVLNNLEENITVVNGDIRKIKHYFEPNSFDCVVSNPPYIKSGGGITNSQDIKKISRHEINVNLEEVIHSTAFVLKQHGSFFMVHRPDRLVDIFYLMRKYKIEPKIIRFVHPSTEKAPNLLLIKGIKCGNPQLKVLNPLYVYDNGEYTKEILKIYGMVKINE